MKVRLAAACLLACTSSAWPQDGALQNLPLNVPAGTPLRLYLTKRIPKRTGAPVEGKLLAPVFAFDHEVVPAGTQVFGDVRRTEPVAKWERIRAVLGGDFTPLHSAEIAFTSLQLPDGSRLRIHTAETPGLNSLFPLKPVKATPVSANGGGVLGTAKQTARDQIDLQMARIRSIPDLVRAPDLKERTADFFISKLPWHPQYVRNRTRFDAELLDPLGFGAESLSAADLSLLGTQPPAGSVAHARLLTALDSRTSAAGEKVEAVLTEPLFSTDRKLLLPEGTLVTGSVVLAKRAGWFHRGGRLRFNFQNVDLPQQVAQMQRPVGAALQFRTQASLSAAEGGKAPVRVDKEGGVQATESKTRFVAALASVMIARAAGDRESEGGHLSGENSNVGGRTLGGGLGFGLLGTIAAQSSPNVGAALGYYGMAWSLFSNIVDRGPEVRFGRNAVIDIGFNTRPETAAAAPPKR